MLPNKCCCEVLRNPRALTLGDEPLAGGMENGPMQLWVEAAELGIPFHDLVHCVSWEQPTSLWQGGI